MRMHLIMTYLDRDRYRDVVFDRMQCTRDRVHKVDADREAVARRIRIRTRVRLLINLNLVAIGIDGGAFVQHQLC